jgi:hypothetical protein
VSALPATRAAEARLEEGDAVDVHGAVLVAHGDRRADLPGSVSTWMPSRRSAAWNPSRAADRGCRS